MFEVGQKIRNRKVKEETQKSKNTTAKLGVSMESCIRRQGEKSKTTTTVNGKC